MRKPSAFLALFQRYPALFTWICIYVLFFVSSSTHQTAIISFCITNSTIIPMIIVWTFINYHLAPKMLHRKPMLYYLSCGAILSIVSIIATEFDLIIYTNLHRNHGMVFPAEMEAAIARGESQRIFLHTKYVVLLIATMAISTISWLLDERKQLYQLQREQRARLELKYLRAQINPHFLFNALNCIYSLTLLQDEKAPDSIMKLSDMLRYVTDDCKSDLVPLQKEITYIGNYIDFQKIRMEHEPDIIVDVKIQNPQYKVPPMLFQPMVENCFKHSRIIDLPSGYIHLSLHQQEKELTFIAENSKPAEPPLSEDKERTGIGLRNVEQRLKLLFRDKAQVNINETDKSYKIIICIKS